MKRRKGKVPRPEFGRGAFVGYSAYRDGSTKPITLAGSGIRPALAKAEREAMVARVVDLVGEWEQTPFEHEGAIRAGLRSGLCLKGNGWETSDAEAGSITSAAFHQIGARRPTWDQGQREHTVPRENCGWCQGPLPTDLLPSGHAKSFCSEECARFAVHYRNLSVADASRDAYKAARRVIEKRRLPKRVCEQCGEDYHPRFGRERFCSTGCVREARRIYHPKPCRACGKTFRPVASKAEGGATIYCSTTCATVARQTKTYPRQCISCGESFEAKSPLAKTCSKPCQHIQNGWQPSTLARPVFDHFFVVPMDDRWRRRVTPQKLDWQFMEMGLRVTGEAALPRAPGPHVTDGLFAGVS